MEANYPEIAQSTALQEERETQNVLLLTQASFGASLATSDVVMRSSIQRVHWLHYSNEKTRILYVRYQ